MLVYISNESNLVCRRCKRVIEPSGFSYMMMVCDDCTDHHRAYITSRQEHFKQRKRAYYLKNRELLGMRLRPYRQLDGCKNSPSAVSVDGE